MKRLIVLICFFLLPLSLCLHAEEKSQVAKYTGDGLPLRYVDGCEIDLNGDGYADSVVWIETFRGDHVFALITDPKTGLYKHYPITTKKLGMLMSCQTGSSVKETLSGQGKGKAHKTPGSYVRFIRPESSSVTFFWDGKKMKEVWTAD